MSGRLAGSLLAALLAAGPAGADEDLQVQALLEPTEAAVGQPVQFTLRVEHPGLSGGELHPTFTLDNLEMIAGPFESQSVQIRNLSVRRSHSMTWQLVPQAPGPAAVRNIRVRVDGRTTQLSDQTLTAIEAPPSATSPPPAGGQRAPTNPLEELMRRLPESLRPGGSDDRPESILRADITPADAWVGEQVLYTLHLYTQTRLRHSNWQHLPSFQSFWARNVPLPEPRRAEIVELDGERYTHAVLLQWALFPLSAGSHEVGPAELELTAEMPGEGLFGSLRREQQRVKLTSRPVKVNVQELPAAPPDLRSAFHGAVGRFELRATLEPQRIRAGDAATLVLELRGRGNLQGVADPALTSPRGLTVHPAASRNTESFDGTVVVGSRTWTFPIVADEARSFTLAPRPVVYFDPWRKEFATAAVEPLVLSVDPAPPTRAPEGPDARSAAARRDPTPAPVIWATAAALLAALAALAVWAWRWPGGQDPPFTSALTEAEAAASPRHAASRIEIAWRDLLVRRLQVPPATPTDHWSERLAAAGAPSRLTTSLDSLLADLRYLRQAPELATTDTLRADLVERSRRLARRLIQRNRRTSP